MPEIVKIVLCVVLAYFLGSIPMSYLVVKWRYHKDIRSFGSGGVGSSNVFRSFSKKLAILIFIYDVGKGTLAVWIVHLIGLGQIPEVLTGIAIVVGHNWPVFLRFNAGRGLATTIGVEAYIFPFGILIFVCGAVFTLVIRSSPLPTLFGIGLVPLASWLMGEPRALTLGLLALFLILIARRLTAPLTERSRQISKRKLFVNRLLFDRDIRDGREWIHFKPGHPARVKKPGAEVK
jgi:acyl phosphate:glycerol-3-phosphate acyltransferase